MPKLKLGSILDEKPVKMTIELSGSVHRDLVAYAEVLRRATGQVTDPAKLVPHMISGFIGSDREFIKQRRQQAASGLSHTADRRTVTADATLRSAGHQADPASPGFGGVDDRPDTELTRLGVSDNSN